MILLPTESTIPECVMSCTVGHVALRETKRVCYGMAAVPYGPNATPGSMCVAVAAAL